MFSICMASSTQYILGLAHVVVLIDYLFSLLHSIPLYRYTTFVYPFPCWRTFEPFPVWGFNRFNHSDHLCIHLGMDICFSFFLSKRLEMKQLDHMAGVCWYFRKLEVTFLSGSTTSYLHKQWRRVLVIPHPNLTFFFLNFRYSNGVQWCLIVILITCILACLKLWHLAHWSHCLIFNSFYPTLFSMV